MLTISHVSKTFAPGTANEHLALDDISLHLAPGEFVTVIGSNGAGKSTLTNAVSGSFIVDKGAHQTLGGLKTLPLSKSTSAPASSAVCFKTP